MSFIDRRLRKCGKPISIQTRAIQPLAVSNVDMGLSFKEKYAVDALISTPRGSVLFDGAGTDQPITHIFTIKYKDCITAEDWIVYDYRRFDILDVENCAECNKVLVLRCQEKGTKEASKA